MKKAKVIDPQFPKGEEAFVSLPLLIDILTALSEEMKNSGSDPEGSIIDGEIAIRYTEAGVEE